MTISSEKGSRNRLSLAHFTDRIENKNLRDHTLSYGEPGLKSINWIVNSPKKKDF